MGLSNILKADLWLVLVTLLAAISWIFSKEAVLIMPPLLFVSLRFLLAALLLSILGFRQIRALNRQQLKQAIGVGIIFALGMCFWIMGVYSGVSLSVGSFLTSLSVVIVPVLDRLFFKGQVPWSAWFAMPIAAIGLGFLSLKTGLVMEKGQLLFLIASLFFALFFILNVRAANHRETGGLDKVINISEKVPALSLTAITLLTVGIMAGILSFVLEGWAVVVSDFSANMVFWVLMSAFIGTAARFFIQTYALSLSNSSHGVVIMVIEPIWTTMLAASWFDESLSGSDLVGCVLIFLSLIINRWSVMRGFFRQATV